MLLFNIGPISHALRSENTEKHYHSKLPMGTIMYIRNNSLIIYLIGEKIVYLWKIIYLS